MQSMFWINQKKRKKSKDVWHFMVHLEDNSFVSYVIIHVYRQEKCASSLNICCSGLIICKVGFVFVCVKAFIFFGSLYFLCN